MPQIQMIDTTPNKPEPTGVEKFFSNVKSYYKDKEDTDIIGGILNQVEAAEDKGKAIQKGIFDLERNKQLSPSRRLAAAKTLREQQDVNLEEKKLANAQAKAELDRLKDKTQVDKFTQEYGLDPELTKDMTPAQVMALGRREEKGGVTSRPVPQKISAAMDRIIDENPNATPSQLQRLADKEGIPQANSRPIIEAIQKERETDFKKQENISKKFDKPIENTREQAIKSQKLLPLTESSIVNNEKYTGAQSTWDTALEATQSPFLSQFKSKTGQQLEAYIPLAVSSFGQKMSGTLTNQKLALITKKAVGLGKDKDANRLLLYMDLYDRKMDILRAEATNEILDKSPTGLAPRDFDTQLNAALKPYQDMVSEDITKLLSNEIPTSEMSELSIGEKTQQNQKQAPPGMIRVRLKSNPKTTGSIAPEKFDKEKYELIKE